MEPVSRTRVDIHGLIYLALDYRRLSALPNSRSRLSPRLTLEFPIGHYFLIPRLFIPNIRQKKTAKDLRDQGRRFPAQQYVWYYWKAIGFLNLAGVFIQSCVPDCQIQNTRPVALVIFFPYLSSSAGHTVYSVFLPSSHCLTSPTTKDRGIPNSQSPT